MSNIMRLPVHDPGFIKHGYMLPKLCHSRNYLSGIWFKTRFPLKTCGNDKQRRFYGKASIRFRILTEQE